MFVSRVCHLLFRPSSCTSAEPLGFRPPSRSRPIHRDLRGQISIPLAKGGIRVRSVEGAPPRNTGRKGGHWSSVRVAPASRGVVRWCAISAAKRRASATPWRSPRPSSARLGGPRSCRRVCEASLRRETSKWRCAKENGVRKDLDEEAS